MTPKKQLKSLLVSRGLAKSLDEAERIILAAQVRVRGELVTQAGALVEVDAELERICGNRYVSRGGLKLEGALSDFSFDPQGLNCIDAGASSGGFTDCLLQAGAARVTAVDVGYGQFNWKLRQDSRVVLFERTNIAKVEPTSLGAPFDVLVADLSFTSLSRLAVQLTALLSDEGQAIMLVKPQFELPKDVVKNGVVVSYDLHVQALERVRVAYEACDLHVQKMSFSPILGPKGNIELWIWLARQRATANIDAKEVVRSAHAELLESK